MEITNKNILKYKNQEYFPVNDRIAVESPLEIVINEEPFSVIMRMPGDDINLVLGLLFNEGIISSYDDIRRVVPCLSCDGNKIDVELKNEYIKKSFYLNKSSCGICGKKNRKELFFVKEKNRKNDTISAMELYEFESKFNSKQKNFKITGATHSAAAFTLNGELLAFAEDIGRHNALDKVIGVLVHENSLDKLYLLMVSSRLSYEMVQKGIRSGAQILVGYSSVTSLAIDMAAKSNLTLIGFFRKNGFNIYSAEQRIITLDEK